jgi:hypothetical protein
MAVARDPRGAETRSESAAGFALGAAAAAPIWFFVCVSLAVRPFSDIALVRVPLLLVSPAGAVVAVMAGARSGRGVERRPWWGKAGLVSGIVELVLMVPLALVPILLWRELNEPL